MEIFKTLLTVVQIVCALGIIGLVLLQQGKGADMGAAFGSGSAGSLFGASGSANFLSRTTAIFATIFFASTLGLTMLGSYKPQATAGVLGQSAPAAKPAADAPPAPVGQQSAQRGAAPAAPAVPK
ncbi:MAG: preprotein translocase subunit SecG [Candidatus Protistobacter heckmanni]|nr:preprotein translocase subunit SecG [Candidatus Protistobacter heckmanni]